MDCVGTDLAHGHGLASEELQSAYGCEHLFHPLIARMENMYPLFFVVCLYVCMSCTL